MRSFLSKITLTYIISVFLLSIIIPSISFADNRRIQQTADATTTITQVICNVVVFIQKLGLPVMTIVIIGSSVMAIFGRLAWPAIVMLIAFSAIFFGASKLVLVFARGVPGVDSTNFQCD